MSCGDLPQSRERRLDLGDPLLASLQIGFARLKLFQRAADFLKLLGEPRLRKHGPEDLDGLAQQLDLGARQRRAAAWSHHHAARPDPVRQPRPARRSTKAPASPPAAKAATRRPTAKTRAAMSAWRRSARATWPGPHH
jgi:hypothetical protein